MQPFEHKHTLIDEQYCLRKRRSHETYKCPQMGRYHYAKCAIYAAVRAWHEFWTVAVQTALGSLNARLVHTVWASKSVLLGISCACYRGRLRGRDR